MLGTTSRTPFAPAYSSDPLYFSGSLAGTDSLAGSLSPTTISQAVAFDAMEAEPEMCPSRNATTAVATAKPIKTGAGYSDAKRKRQMTPAVMIRTTPAIRPISLPAKFLQIQQAPPRIMAVAMIQPTIRKICHARHFEVSLVRHRLVYPPPKARIANSSATAAEGIAAVMCSDKVNIMM